MNNNLSIKFSDKLDILEDNIIAGAYEIGIIACPWCYIGEMRLKKGI